MADGDRSLSSLPSPPAPPSRRPRLGDMLVDAGLLSAEDLQVALDHQARHGGRLGTVLVGLGMLDEEILDSTLGKQLGIRVAEVENLNPPPELLRQIPERVMRRHELIPLSLRNRVLEVGMCDPGNQAALDELRFLGFPRVEVRLVTESSFQRFMRTRYAPILLLDQVMNDPELARLTRSEAPAAPADANLPPVIRLASHLLERAVEHRASDIHVEPYESFFRVRYRVDGAMHTVLTPPSRLHAGVVSRLKVMCGLDITERRKPQDGHMALDLAGESVHFRVSVLPTVFGEKVCIRILRKEAQLADLGLLGLARDQLATLKRVARLPQGLILVTGPTGSGKTTTVHALLNLLNEPDVNLVTLEDPVESTIAGVNHVTVNERGGVSFASALRSILRQDPDVVFVGEMRDQEVSQIAVRAALTGHLVLSTLHTNGAMETFARLADMGVEPFLVASSLKLVVAQRLLRRLCPRCSTPGPVPEALVREFGLTPEQLATATYRAPGQCRACLNTGYRGRVAVYELLEPDEALRAALRRKASDQEVFEVARAAGVRWLWDAGIAAALAGTTSFDEVREGLSPPAATQ